MSAGTALRMIARCTRCGRSFAWLPNGFAMRDRYPPENDRQATDLCGGRIERICEEAAQ